MSKLLNNPGIYKIENILTKEFYIGSSVNLRARKNAHFRRLRSNTHYNRHLQNSFNKHGKENFTFTILLICEIEELIYYEQFLVDLLKPAYNKRLIVDSNRGRKLSKEHIKFMSETRRGIPKPYGFGNKIRLIKLGKKWKEGTKIKQSNIQKGMKHKYPSTRKQISDKHRLQQSLRIKNWWDERKSKHAK